MSLGTLRRSVSGGTLSAFRGAEAVLRPGTRRPLASVESVLILHYMLPLGVAVHMTPVYEALKRRPNPPTVIVATRGLGLQVLRRSPFIDHLISTPDPLTDLRGAAVNLRTQLHARRLTPQAILTGTGDQRSRIALLGMLACNAPRAGYTVHSGMYQHPLTIDKTKSLIWNNLRIAALAGAPSDLLEPRVWFNGREAAEAEALLAPLRSAGRPVLTVVSQNSGGQRTGWHRERWAQAVSYAHRELGYEVAWVGTAPDAAAIEELRHAAHPAGLGTSLAGKTSVAVLAGCLAASDLVLSLDTGTMHVGRAVGVPMVVLGPSWQKPVEWLPLGNPKVAILRGEDRDDIPPGYQLDEITPEAVMGTLKNLSTAYPADASSRQERLRASLSEIDLLA